MLEARRLLAAGGVGDLLALATDDLLRGRHDFADTWRPLASVSKPSKNAVSHLRAKQFDAFALDESDLRQTLALAPLEFTQAAETPVEVIIPAPDGSSPQRFAVVETMVMARELAAEFPQIKTYRGQGIDDPTASVRLDLTPAGFHAQVMAPGNTYYIDPYWHRSKSVYAAYWRKDVSGTRNEIDVLHAEHDHAEEALLAGESSILAETAERSSGTQLRTYRTAVAATGEYTAFHGGTVALGQAAIVTSVNRVSGIYETELAIRLQLVANNSSLVFTNAGSDPYTNNDGVAMLSQNQTRVDTTIGSGNYDIGHVFSTGGGGIAYLESVGQAGIKAGGVTGQPNPVGDGFDVDYVAHEMGHQFGGPHTFNTSAASSQRDAAHAYEPGSGTTIMAYAGITGNNSDLALHSDPYFHADSFNSIVTYVDDDIPGVGTRTNTGNAIPSVNAGPNYAIPTGTPFALTASGSDANPGDVLTYDWEQMDLGSAALLNANDNGTRPLFRVYNPTTSPTRTFPQLSSILAGSPTTAAPFGGFAERLPTSARASMDFRVTVRDNRAGGGGVNSDDMAINVVNTGAAFLISSHNSAATLPGGSNQTVTWNVAGTTAGPISAASVNIRLSTDGGLTFPTLLATNVSNDGSESVTIPSVATTQARIKIEPTNNIFFDINNANLTITAAATPSATPSAPDLMSATDTGPSNSDNITNRDNSSAAKNLQFSVGGTVSGATVAVYYNGTLIGSAVASGTTTTVTTSGTVDIPDSPPARAVTARQTESGKTQSPDSAALNLTIDTAAPTADIVNITPDPRTTGVTSATVNFSEPVSGFDLADVSLTRTGGPNLLTASQAPTGGPASFTVPNLIEPTSINGSYTLLVTAAGSGITDTAGNALATSAGDSWIHNIPAWLSASGTAASWNSLTKVLTVSGSATIIADPAADDPSITASGASATVNFNPASGQRVRIATLKLSGGATATLASLGAARTAANHRVLLVDGPGGLDIDATSRLDLTDNDLILDYAPADGTPLTKIEDLLTAGFNGGDWEGAGGIVSSKAALDPTLLALGYAENTSLPIPFGTAQSGPLFTGQEVDDTAVLVKFTWSGDLNLDGIFDFQDLSIFNGNYDSGASSGRLWVEGDVNYDGVIDFQDLSIFNGNYDPSRLPW